MSILKDKLTKKDESIAQIKNEIDADYTELLAGRDGEIERILQECNKTLVSLKYHFYDSFFKIHLSTTLDMHRIKIKRWKQSWMRLTQSFN